MDVKRILNCQPCMRWTPPTDMLTFAEIAPEQKLAVSHRGRAMGRMRDLLVITSLGATLQVFKLHEESRFLIPRLGRRQ